MREMNGMRLFFPSGAPFRIFVRRLFGPAPPPPALLRPALALPRLALPQLALPRLALPQLALPRLALPARRLPEPQAPLAGLAKQNRSGPKDIDPHVIPLLSKEPADKGAREKSGSSCGKHFDPMRSSGLGGAPQIEGLVQPFHPSLFWAPPRPQTRPSAPRTQAKLPKTWLSPETQTSKPLATDALPPFLQAEDGTIPSRILVYHGILNFGSPKMDSLPKRDGVLGGLSPRKEHPQYDCATQLRGNHPT